MGWWSWSSLSCFIACFYWWIGFRDRLCNYEIKRISLHYGTRIFWFSHEKIISKINFNLNSIDKIFLPILNPTRLQVNNSRSTFIAVFVWTIACVFQNFLPATIEVISIAWPKRRVIQTCLAQNKIEQDCDTDKDQRRHPAVE